MAWSVSRIAVVAAACLVALQGSVNAQTNEPVPSFKEVSVAENAFSLGDAVPAWVDPVTAPITSNSEPAALRIADTQFLAGETPVIYFHRALAINNTASLSEAGQIQIPFAAEYQRLQLHSVSIIRDGEKHDRTKSATIRFLKRETGIDSGVYRGLVTVLVVVNDLRIGDTVECKYSLHGQNPVFGGKFVDWASLDQGYPGYRRIIFNYPAERKISWRLIGDRQPAPVAPRESVDAGLSKLIFVEPNGAALPTEPLTPARYSALRWLQFSEFNDWNEVATWANDLFKVSESPNGELSAIIEKLRRQPSNDERVAAALAFVQSEIRYFSIALGESSHRPAQPNVVLDRRYGDCKDKSLLLLTILKELGIPGKAVLLQTGRKHGLEKQLPSPLSFDHVIVQATVDGKVFYLDPTRQGQYGRLDRMGDAHAGTQILVVDPETRETAVIPNSAPERYLSVVSEKATLATLNGDAELEVRETWTGLLAERNRSLFAQVTKERLNSLVASTVERVYPGATIVRGVDIEDDQVNNTLSSIVVYRVPKYAMERDGFWIARFIPSNMAGTLPMPNTVSRKDPVQIANFPFKTKYSFEATFPENISMVTDPLTKTIKNKHFVYTITSAFRGNRAKADLELSVLANRIEVADVAGYANDLREVNNIPTGAVVIPKGAIKSASGGSPSGGDLPVRIKNQTLDSIKRITAAIDSGKLSGNDLAEAYCNRATRYSNLERTNEALQDANRALKIASESPSFLGCRAEIYFSAGQFEKSANDYSRVIELGDTRTRAFYLRGMSRFYAGRLEEAAGDFLRASETEDYAALWAVWTFKRMGRPAPEDLVKRAAAGMQDEWPKPALAMLTGKLSPEELLKIINAKTGDDRHMALAEGYFYLGQHYLAQGKKAQAVEYFEKTLRQNMTIYVEHKAAKFELASMKKGR